MGSIYMEVERCVCVHIYKPTSGLAAHSRNGLSPYCSRYVLCPGAHVYLYSVLSNENSIEKIFFLYYILIHS